MTLTPDQQKAVEKLRKMDLSAVDWREIAQGIIDTHKLPYSIAEINGVWELTKAKTPGEQWSDRFITTDPDTLAMKERAAKAADVPDEVLIVGETGTGKELIAKSMIGERTGPIKSVNCAGLPRDLIESILFGHVRGSFTGAIKDNDGLILSATNGLMFMDEIGDLPLEQQAKLLRVLQDKEVWKVGGISPSPVNCKFVFATNRDIRQMVKDKQFREDLYARISILELDIKPLRDRVCDMKPILESIDGGVEFMAGVPDWQIKLDVSLNVRSLQRAVRRWKVWGSI